MPREKYRPGNEDSRHVIQIAVSGNQKQCTQGLWCPWLHGRAFFLVVSCVSPDWHREYLLPITPRVTDSDSASRLSRTRRQTHNENFDINSLRERVVCMDLFITETTVHLEAHANHGQSVRTGIYTEKSSDQVIKCHAHTETLSNPAVVTVFFLLFLC